MEGFIGKKLGMTQVFDENGNLIPVTVIQAGPCYVTQIKTSEKDGYTAIQVGFDACREKVLNKPIKGHLKKGNVGPVRVLKEIRVKEEEIENYKLGQEIKVSEVFKKGELVKVTGYSKGRGFAGAMKRYNFGGGRDSHGAKYHRKPFSIGMHTDPGRVFKNKRMPGHYGTEKFTIRHLRVVDVDSDKNFLIVRGAVPGARNGYVFIRKDY